MRFACNRKMPLVAEGRTNDLVLETANTSRSNKLDRERERVSASG